MHKKKGKDGKTMFRILPCASSVINPDSQAVLCLTVAGLPAPLCELGVRQTQDKMVGSGHKTPVIRKRRVEKVRL